MKKSDFVYKELHTQINRIKYIEALLAEKPEADYYPRRVFIEPTNFCNCKCVHCPNARTMSRKRGYMDFDLYTRIIDELGELWPYVTVNLFQQGEPLLHPRIFDMIDYANAKNLFTEMNTNLGALKQRDLRSLLRVNYLRIAVDAASRETYRAVKGVAAFDKTLDNMLDFLEAWGEEATHESYAPDVTFLKQAANAHEADIFQEMVSRLPVGHVSVFNLHNFTGAIEEGAAAVQQTAGPEPICNTPWDYLGINWDGTAVACVYDFDSRYPVGHVQQDAVLDIWDNQRMRQFRKHLLDREFEKNEPNGPMCSVCSVRHEPDYWPPQDYYKEVGRMETYLTGAVRRVSLSRERHEELMEKWRYLKQNREAWKAELEERTRQAAAQSSQAGTPLP